VLMGRVFRLVVAAALTAVGVVGCSSNRDAGRHASPRPVVVSSSVRAATMSSTVAATSAPSLVTVCPFTAARVDVLVGGSWELHVQGTQRSYAGAAGEFYISDLGSAGRAESLQYIDAKCYLHTKRLVAAGWGTFVCQSQGPGPGGIGVLGALEANRHVWMMYAFAPDKATASQVVDVFSNLIRNAAD